MECCLGSMAMTTAAAANDESATEPSGEKVACGGSPFWVQVSRHPDDLVDTDGLGATAPRDYMVDRSVFDDAQAKWGVATIDAFASEATALLPRFWYRL